MKKRKKINFFRFAFIILLLFFVFEVVKQEYKIYKLNSEIASTRNRIVELADKHQALQKECDDINSPKYIEKVAREEYNMVKKEEVLTHVKE